MGMAGCAQPSEDVCVRHRAAFLWKMVENKYRSMKNKPVIGTCPQLPVAPTVSGAPNGHRSVLKFSSLLATQWKNAMIVLVHVRLTGPTPSTDFPKILWTANVELLRPKICHKIQYVRTVSNATNREFRAFWGTCG